LISSFRHRFRIPSRDGKELIYFLGNSLGLQPVTASDAIQHILDQWSYHGVEGFFKGPDAWMDFHDCLTAPLSEIIGSSPSEVVVMNHLTVNLHLMMTSFYRPIGKRNKIICEAKAFPSDQYMLETHLKSRGLDPNEIIIEVQPRQNEYEIRTEDIIAVIHQHANEVAMVFWGGVNYYTGQRFDMASITSAAHDAGAVAGFDLAHAIGNVHLHLHEWNVDFACWCSYKYLNSGPGGIAGAFIHERYHGDDSIPRLAGWWGYPKESRFLMEKGFRATNGAEGWHVSTPPVMLYALHKVSLDIFSEAGMENLANAGNAMSDYFIQSLQEINRQLKTSPINILTPADKGCQVSLLLKKNAKLIFEQLDGNGIFADWREPGVIRAAPVPLYNTTEEIDQFIQVMKKLLL
jgi:kynureninase